MTAREEIARDATGHIRSLDALRGLAAVVVVLRHTIEAVALPVGLRHALTQGLLAPLLNAQGAVQLFFVLSGYVLARSLVRPRKRLLIEFYIKRIFRIYPPYVVAVLFAWGLSAFYLPIVRQQGLTLWLRIASGAHVSIGQLPATLLFPGEALGLLWVGWTLRVEMIFSFLLPFLVVAARALHGIPLLLSCVVLLFFDFGGEWPWYAIDFALGVVAFQHQARLAYWLGPMPRLGALLLVLVGLGLFAAPLWLGWAHPAAGLVVGPLLPAAILVLGVGSTILVVAAVALPAVRRGLSKRPLLFLGRISFSLYLVHLAWISLLAPRLVVPGRPASVAALLAAVLLASVASAALGYRLVERPSIACGDRVCAFAARLAGRYEMPISGVDL